MSTPEETGPPATWTATDAQRFAELREKLVGAFNEVSTSFIRYSLAWADFAKFIEEHPINKKDSK